MATRRTAGDQRPRKGATPPPEPVDDDLAVADELLRLAREDRAVIDAEREKLRKALKRLGVRLPARPIDPRKLRERLLKKGFDPTSNEFSRGIIEMREE